MVRGPVYAQAWRSQFGPEAADHVAISPLNGPPGAEVLLTASGLPAGSLVYLAAGCVFDDYTVVGRARVDARGDPVTSMAILVRAHEGDRWIFMVLGEDRRVAGGSNPFTVDRAAVMPPVRVRGY